MNRLICEGEAPRPLIVYFHGGGWVSCDIETHDSFCRALGRAKHSISGLNQGRFVRIAGIVTGRQRPRTKVGVVFLTLEDETGNVSVIVWKDVQERCIAQSILLLIKGTVETDHNVTHVIAGDLIDCRDYLKTARLESRDFH